MSEFIINQTLDTTRRAVLATINQLIQEKKALRGAYEQLYHVVSDYPFRKGKSLRPALCISTARSMGGFAQNALVSSAAIELFHNAALIHDDIEDESDLRRGQETMHHKMGVGRAVNIGDATHVLSLSLLLENLRSLGVAKSMQVMHEIENMARQSVEGQAMELDWISLKKFDLTDEDYFRMCNKKTCWYTFISPCRIGYIIGSQQHNETESERHLALLTEFGMAIGIAFQIQDDLLNLVGDEAKYGKEKAGDIFEGKRTIMLNHLIRTAEEHRSEIIEIMSLPRHEKTTKQIAFILAKMEEHGSIEYGRKLASHYTDKAHQLLDQMTFLKELNQVHHEETWEAPNADKKFIRSLVDYVIERNI